MIDAYYPSIHHPHDATSFKERIRFDSFYENLHSQHSNPLIHYQIYLELNILNL